MHLSVHDHEDIFARTLGDITLVVEQQCFVAAGFDGFAKRENRIDVISCCLGLAHGDVHMVPRVGRGAHGDAPLARLGCHVVRPLPGGNGNVNREIFRAQSHGFAAEEDNRAKVALFKSIGGENLPLCVVEFFFRVGNPHLQYVGGIEQAPGVVLQAENHGALGCLIGAHAFEYRQSVVQAMREHVYLGFLPGYEMSIEPDEPITVRKAAGKSGFGHLALSFGDETR